MTGRAVATGLGEAMLVVILTACAGSTSRYSVVLDELNDPRGMTLRADGTLCVAETGRLEEGDVIRSGPTTNRAETGSLTCVDGGGNRQRLVERLPYVRHNADGITVGPTDVVEVNEQLYLLTGEGTGEFSRAVLRIDDAGSRPTVIADFFVYAEQTAVPDFFDEINVVTNPFAMIADPQNDRFLITDGATGEVYSAGLDGEIRVYSQVEGYAVLTGIAWGPDGLAYVASFSELPHEQGTGAIVRIHHDGQTSVAVADLTTPIDLAFDRQERLYVLEFTSASAEGHPYRDRTGRLLRFEPASAGWEGGQVLLEGLPHPTALLVESDGTIYITVNGAYSEPGRGKVLSLAVTDFDSENAPAIQYAEP